MTYSTIHDAVINTDSPVSNRDSMGEIKKYINKLKC